MANKKVVLAFVEAIGPKSRAVVSLGKFGRVEVMQRQQGRTPRGEQRGQVVPQLGIKSSS